MPVLGVGAGDGVVVAGGRDTEGDGDGEGVTVSPSARLTVGPPEIVNIRSNANPAQMTFARGRDDPSPAHLLASCLGACWSFFTIGSFKVGLGVGRNW